MISEKKCKKKNLRVFQMNSLKEFDLYIDIVLIVYMFCIKILFFLGWCEKIVKTRDAQGGIKKNNDNNDYCTFTIF